MLLALAVLVIGTLVGLIVFWPSGRLERSAFLARLGLLLERFELPVVA
jgi:hypothetical protein